MKMKLLVILAALVVICNAGKGGGPPHKGGPHGKKHKCMEQKMEMAKCCKLPEVQDETLESCKAKFEGEEKWDQHLCTAECMFKEKGIMGEDRELNADKMKEVSVAFAFGDTDWEEVMSKSATDCTEKYNIMKDKLAEKSAERKQKCYPAAQIIGMCMMFNNIENCPASSWDNSDECNELKAKIEADEECKDFKKA